MGNEDRLQKLRQLQIKRGDGPLFKSTDDCMTWIDNVAPLLKYDQQHYYEFCEHAKIVRITSLTVTTLMPQLNAMIGIVNQAIMELENDIEPIKEDREEHDAMMRSFHGVPLSHEIEATPDIELAELQSTLASDSPGKIIIENEWQRRKLSKKPDPTTTPTDRKTPKASKSIEWYQRPIGYIGITVVSGILILLAAYLIKKHLGIPL